MGTLFILGSGGMLGQELSRRASTHRGLNFVKIGTAGDVDFNFSGQELSGFFENLGITEADSLVNCIGWIPQKATGDAEEDLSSAYLLNSVLPQRLEEAQRKIGFQWIQILTDCVFSGGGGPYFETSQKDAKDLYGLSKISGERFMNSAVAIRCSIVGPDSRSTAGLYSWFKSTSRVASAVNGFGNVYWNGVSTRAFAQLAIGIHLSKTLPAGVRHWIPKDAVSKFDLLNLFARNLKPKPPIKIVRSMQSQPLDRRLGTLDLEGNRHLWRLAGYSEAPSIADMCAEFVDEDLMQDRL